ncbi:MAG: hypothetical protein MUF42_04565 [Cytophagaceae bacterium]|jgi:hypothetical protein|nr:hypothetical protein [Cytophagaceae bacterium]
MKNWLFGGLLALFLPAWSAEVSLQEALQQKKVALSAKGNGGFQGSCLHLELNNLTQAPISIKMDPGAIFKDQDLGAQNLMLVEEYMVLLKPKQKQSLDAQTMCIEHHDYSPAQGDAFVYASMAQGYLLELAQLLARKNYQNSTAQSAVWAITDKSSIGDIYATDTTMASELLDVVCKATGQKRPAIITPKEHLLYAIRFSFSEYFMKPQRLTLRVYDKEGKIIRTYFENKAVAAGAYVSTMGINRVDEKGSAFVFKLSDESGRILQERLCAASVNEAPPVVYEKKFNFQYVLKEPVASASLKLYDAQGNLLDVFFEKRNLPAGGRQLNNSFFHFKGPQAEFLLRVEDERGNILAEKKLTGPSTPKRW